MDEGKENYWTPGKLVSFKSARGTSMWEEPSFPLSYPLPLITLTCSTGLLLESTQYSCKIFAGEYVGWVDKIDMYMV